MTKVRTLLFFALLTLTSGSAFALGGASADCDGDGTDDVSCYGGTGGTCQASDGVGCACLDSEGRLSDVRSCGAVIAGPDSQANATWNELFPTRLEVFDLEPPFTESTGDSSDQEKVREAA